MTDVTVHIKGQFYWDAERLELCFRYFICPEKKYRLEFQVFKSADRSTAPIEMQLSGRDFMLANYPEVFKALGSFWGIK